MVETKTIEIDSKTLYLLDIVKKYSPEASYNDVILFLIGQYSKRLEDLQIQNVNKKVIMENEEAEQ